MRTELMRSLAPVALLGAMLALGACAATEEKTTTTAAAAPAAAAPATPAPAAAAPAAPAAAAAAAPPAAAAPAAPVVPVAGPPAYPPTPGSDAAFIKAAVADAGRPAADKDLDEERKPADMMAIAEVQPGDKIGELLPGAGFMTRVFSKSVGANGKVYLFNGPAAAGRALGFQGILDDKTNYPNVSFIQTDFTTIAAPEKLDLVWTSQNYHDMHNPGRNLDINKANKAVFDALKPGGIYVVLDHQSKAGTDFDAGLHRIDMAKVKAEVLAAGFQFVTESNVLRNPNDPRDKGVFDASIRRKTDQFILKFKKPG